MLTFCNPLVFVKASAACNERTNEERDANTERPSRRSRSTESAMRNAVALVSKFASSRLHSKTHAFTSSHFSCHKKSALLRKSLLKELVVPSLLHPRSTAKPYILNPNDQNTQSFKPKRSPQSLTYMRFATSTSGPLIGRPLKVDFYFPYRTSRTEHFSKKGNI